jgi:ankyrin repeat protein
VAHASESAKLANESSLSSSEAQTLEDKPPQLSVPTVRPFRPHLSDTESLVSSGTDASNDSESITGISSKESSDPVIKRRPQVTTTAEKNAALTERMHSLFENIRTGRLARIDELPNTSEELRNSGIYLNQIHPQTLCTPLTTALKYKQTAIAITLLILGADPLCTDGNKTKPSSIASPLCMMVIRFFELRSKPEARVKKTKESGLLRLLFAKVEPDSGHTLLSWAICEGHDKLVELLVASGADFEDRNAVDMAPLEIAVRCGSMQAINSMLSAWPHLVEHINLPHLIEAIYVAAQTNRPALVGQLISFFRLWHRAYRDTRPEREQEDSWPSAQPNPDGEQEAYQFFLSGKSSSSFTIAQVMHRTRDDCLLTDHEASLLQLHKVEWLSLQLGFKKVLEMVRAHIKQQS